MSLTTCEQIEQIMVNAYINDEPTELTGKRLLDGTFSDDEINEYISWNNARVDNEKYERGIDAKREAHRKGKV
ncbi:MAG: hypothetical protein HRT86_14955 [Ilumatobacteraceae bacterium]|nr:hypothetical protein [Ilumatobacteraceae bacterium]